MKIDFDQAVAQIAALFGEQKGMPLKAGRLTGQGIELVFENSTRRSEIHFLPQVYTEGKVIVDAINDLTLVVELKNFQAKTNGSGAPKWEMTGGGRVELPYSTWFNEGDYL